MCVCVLCVLRSVRSAFRLRLRSGCVLAFMLRSGVLRLRSGRVLVWLCAFRLCSGGFAFSAFAFARLHSGFGCLRGGLRSAFCVLAMCLLQRLSGLALIHLRSGRFAFAFRGSFRSSREMQPDVQSAVRFADRQIRKR